MKHTVLHRISVLLLCLCLISGVVSARSSSEIRRELDALKEQEEELTAARQSLEAELAANAAETKTIIEEKSALDRRIYIIEAELRNVEAQIQQHGLLVAAKQADLEAAQAEYAALNETYRARIRAMEENGSVSYWSVLFQANSFSDLLDRIDMIHEIAEADQRMLEALSAAAEAIELEQSNLRKEVEARQTMLAQLESLETELAQQRAEADKMLIRLGQEADLLTESFQAAQAQEDALREEVMQAQADYEKALSAEEAARLAEQNKNNVAGGGGSAGNSGFLCPVPPGAWVTDAFGYRNHPLYGYYSLHTGVDLAANQGTEIYATAAGTVTRAGYTDANGYYVALAHGGGYGSIYLHMTYYIVNVGDSVKQGQVIGYVGSTGWSSGPHLHFEIHKDGVPVNPMEYISLT